MLKTVVSLFYCTRHACSQSHIYTMDLAFVLAFQKADIFSARNISAAVPRIQEESHSATPMHLDRPTLLLNGQFAQIPSQPLLLS